MIKKLLSLFFLFSVSQASVSGGGDVQLDEKYLIDRCIDFLIDAGSKNIKNGRILSKWSTVRVFEGQTPIRSN